MRRSDFEFVLPSELIAQSPLPQRSASRLLELAGPGIAAGAAAESRAATAYIDHPFRSLPQLLRPHDLLVFNDTRVLPARLAAQRATGGRVEIFLERALGGHSALVHLRASNVLRADETIASAGGSVRLVAQRDDLWEVMLPEPAVEFFEHFGAVPLPPYISRAPLAADRERYQSLLARVPGAVAAPTASLHFDQPLLDELAARQIGRTTLTLHVGAGTFQPVRSDDLDAHVMHAERYEISAGVVDAVCRTRTAGGRVIAAGTTVARALESAVTDGQLRAVAAETTLFIRPGFRFHIVDGLITNFHLPGSTLLMLVAAYAGRERVLAAYAHAVQQRYRFFSYGDAMLLWPATGVRT